MDKSVIEQAFAGRWQVFYSKYLPSAVKKGGAEYKALCPFHDDQHPSFEFNSDRGLYLCRACGKKGAPFHFYAKTHGLDDKRDFPKILQGIAQDFGLDTTEVKPHVVKAYSYYDEEGAELFQVCRMEPKDFRQRHKVGDKWQWDLKNVRRVLYNLPLILNADRVLIVEGEKDCDNLFNLGFVATTNPMGAEKWQPEYSEYLNGKDVVLIPDNDLKGREHIIKVAQSLQGHAISIRWLELPDMPSKGDASDYIAEEKDDCPSTYNPEQEDHDFDNIGDACDTCTDTDGDGYGNPGFSVNTCPEDGCPNDYAKAAPGQCGCGFPDTDSDSDGTPDCNDGCPNDSAKIIPGQCGCGIPDLDPDSDTVASCIDNCPLVVNSNQLDSDNDSIGNACDNCPETANKTQLDYDNDTLGDLCDNCTDTEQDGYGNPGFPLNTCLLDNCPFIYNPDQSDDDKDGIGNTCDTDWDNDGVLNEEDNCPFIPNGPDGGTCTWGPKKKALCTVPGYDPMECGEDGFCSMNQEDTIEPVGNERGDACETTTSTSTTTTVGRSGGGGGGGTRSTTSTTTSIFVPNSSTTTTSIPVPLPDCEVDSDCTDNFFCNGQEKCSDGKCIAGQTPCAVDELCMEDLDECWGLETLTAQSLQTFMMRPFILQQRCSWLILQVADDNHFDQSSTITLTGPSEGAGGVVADQNRTAFKFWQFILVPICIDNDAMTGLWQVEIETDVQDPTGSFMETIKASFEVR